MDFPTKDKFKASDVTEMDFSITGKDHLYVDLDKVRDESYLSDIKFKLKIDGDRLAGLTDNFVKILFTGHRGCGKTTELIKFQNYINSPERYCSAFLDLEKETELAHFQYEDLFVVLIGALINKADELGVSLDHTELATIASEWLSDEEVLKELRKDYAFQAGGGGEAGVSFLSFIKIKSTFKTLFSTNSTTAKRIRETIRKNPYKLIERLNLAISSARKGFVEGGCGKDLLFIIDGFEKMPVEVYTRLFIKESGLIKSLNVNMIFTIPINSSLEIEKSASPDFFNVFVLPMIKVKDEGIPALKAIITRRIDQATFIENDALTLAVEMSGGCIRQLLRIVNRSLLLTSGGLSKVADIQKACDKLGQEMCDRLDSEHIKILKGEKAGYYNSDAKTLDLLYSLAILKYNGHRDINPLLKRLFPQEQPQC